MLQAENTPAQLISLQDVIHVRGVSHLKFYLFGLVCMMCGLSGGIRGSIFMNAENSKKVMAAIQCLRKLNAAPPLAIYWGYVIARARELGMPTSTPEDLAIVRLACLTRATRRDCAELLKAWY